MLLRKRERKIRRILIVEDEPLVAFDNEHMLVDAGYEVVATVDNFDDAARVITEATLDLVLSDMALAGERTGLDVAISARKRGVPVLFVTARPPELASQHAIGCLAKPYSDRGMKAALTAVDQLLQGNRMKRLPSGLTLFEVVPSVVVSA